MNRRSITGADELSDAVRRLDAVSVPKLIHAALLRQLRAKRAQIPRATGALERSLLDGSDDTVTDHRVAIEGLAYGAYHDLPKVNARRATDEVARELFKRAGLSGGF